MKKAKEQLKIRKSNQIPTEVKSKAEEVSRALLPCSARVRVQAILCAKVGRPADTSASGAVSSPQRCLQPLNLQGPKEGLVTFVGERREHACNQLSSGCEQLGHWGGWWGRPPCSQDGHWDSCFSLLCVFVLAALRRSEFRARAQI